MYLCIYLHLKYVLLTVNSLPALSYYINFHLELQMQQLYPSPPYHRPIHSFFCFCLGPSLHNIYSHHLFYPTHCRTSLPSLILPLVRTIRCNNTELNPWKWKLNSQYSRTDTPELNSVKLSHLLSPFQIICYFS